MMRWAGIVFLIIGVLLASAIISYGIAMRISAPVTDYIRASTMNTQGDLVVRGALVPERLTAGANGTFFRGQGAGVIPTYDVLGGVLDTYLKAQGAAVNPIFEALTLRDTGVHIGDSTRTTAGNQVITGVGFTPSIVIFIAADTAADITDISIGFDKNGTRYVVGITNDGGNVIGSASWSIYILFSGSHYIRAKITVLSADGFTLNWDLFGSRGAKFGYLCLP